MRLSLVTAVAAATVCAAMSVASAAIGSSADEQAIRRVVDAMNEAFNHHDEAVARSFMTDDADYVNVRGSRLKGAQQISSFRQARFEGALRRASIRVLNVDIRFIRSDVALVHELHEIAGMLDEHGKQLPPHRELSLRVFIKQQGRWLVTAFQNTSVDASAPLTPPN
jgi:uncharacterized protein (TIGR02246 family)